jgi:hypothetical protein
MLQTDTPYYKYRSPRTVAIYATAKSAETGNKLNNLVSRLIKFGEMRVKSQALDK